MSKEATIKHVASQASVSVGTVSRYLNGATTIGEANAAKIQAAIDSLGYRPSASARNLAGRRNGRPIKSGNLGLFFNQMSAAWASNETTETYIKGVEAVCEEHGLHPIIEFGGKKSDRIPRFIEDRKVDGLLIAGIEPSEAWLNSIPEGIPIVGVGALNHDTPIPLVSADNFGAGRTVARHLWEKGHRKIAFLCPATTNHMFIHRRQGIEEFLQLKGCFNPELAPPVSINPLRINVQPESSPPIVDEELTHLLGLPKELRPTAIVAPNDWIALSVYNGLRARGITPGEEISIVGFDNAISICCSVYPALTSYAVGVKESAYVAAKLLYQHLTSDMSDFPRTIQLVSGELIERDSVRSLPPQ